MDMQPVAGHCTISSLTKKQKNKIIFFSLDKKKTGHIQ